MVWVLGYAATASFLVGAFLIALALRNARKGQLSRQWPQFPGRIIRSFVFVDTDSEGGEGYTPRVEYEYAVAGAKYQGARLRYGQTGSSTRERAERIVAGYPSGSSVMVFVNPRQPEDAVLVSGTSWGNVAILLAGLVFIGAAIALIQVQK